MIEVLKLSQVSFYKFSWKELGTFIAKALSKSFKNLLKASKRSVKNMHPQI